MKQQQESNASISPDSFDRLIDASSTTTEMHHSLASLTSPDDIQRKFVPYFNSPDTLTYSATSLIEPFAIPDGPYYYFPPVFTAFGPATTTTQDQAQQTSTTLAEVQSISSPESNSDLSDITDPFPKMEQSTLDNNDYNVALTLVKEVPVPQLVSYPQQGNASMFTSSLADCFPMHPSAADMQSFVAGLATPPLSKLEPSSPLSPLSSISPLSPLSPVDDHYFDLDAKSLFSRDLQALDARDYFSTESLMEDLIRYKSLDDVIFRKLGASQTKSEDEPTGLVRRKSLPADLTTPVKQSRKSAKSLAPFACPHEHCPKTFTRQYNLKSHLRTHTDERPFICNYPGCPRAFARQHDLKRHQKLHLGLKPHVCGNCGRAFARLDALNRHLRSDNAAQCAQATLAGAIGLGVSVGGKFLKSATL